MVRIARAIIVNNDKRFRIMVTRYFREHNQIWIVYHRPDYSPNDSRFTQVNIDRIYFNAWRTYCICAMAL